MNDDSPISSDALLCAKNFQMFTDNLNITGDREVAHQFQFIDLEPIRAVVVEFKELGLTTQARLLENACNFALGIKRSYNAAPFGSTGRDLAPVNYTMRSLRKKYLKTRRRKPTNWLCSAGHSARAPMNSGRSRRCTMNSGKSLQILPKSLRRVAAKAMDEG